VRRAARVGLAALAGLVLGGAAVRAEAHEEQLVRGRLEQVDPRAGVLLVRDTARERTVRVTVDPETAVWRCRTGPGPQGLRPGVRVRVTYLDPGRAPFTARSILVLPGEGKEVR